MRKVSRRSLLRSATGLAAVYCASHLLPAVSQLSLAEASQAPAVVVAEGTNDDTPEILLRTALAPLGGIERFVKPGQTVAIKPNATWANKPHTASSTDPDLLRALIAMVKAAGAKRIIIVDRCTIDPPAMCLAESGIGKVLDETGVEQVLLDAYREPKSKYVEIDVPAGKAFQRLGVIKAAAEADVRINMAVAKTHAVLPVTLCLKHMMGFLENPGALHASLDQGIADLANAPGIRPALHILEAIRVRVRGPSYGDGTDVTDPARVKRHNQIIAGIDPLLIDAYAVTRFFERAPEEITHIKRSFESKVGEIDVEKAIASGSLRTYHPGEWKPPTPTSTPTPIATAEVAPTEQALTPTPVAPAAPTAAAPAAAETAGEVVLDISPRLNGALVPLAAIIGGTGMVVGRRLAGRLQRQAAPPATGEPAHGSSGAVAPAKSRGPEDPHDR